MTVALLMGKKYPKTGAKGFNIFLVHLLTTSHTIRILLPIVKGKWHINLLKLRWSSLLTIYIA